MEDIQILEKLKRIYESSDTSVRKKLEKEFPNFFSDNREWSINDVRTWKYIISDVLTYELGIGQYLDTSEELAILLKNKWSKRISTNKIVS